MKQGKWIRGRLSCKRRLLGTVRWAWAANATVLNAVGKSIQLSVRTQICSEAEGNTQSFLIVYE